MSGYSQVTSKPKRELFGEIKRFRAKIEAGDPPIGPLVASTDVRTVDVSAQQSSQSDPFACLTPAACRLPSETTEPLVVGHRTQALGPSIDFIWIDNEHTPMSYEALAGHILAAHLHGVAVIVRVQVRHFSPFSRAFFRVFV